MPDRLDPSAYRMLVREALAEDVGPGDVTTAATVPAGARARGAIVVRADCVVAGLEVAKEVFAQVDPAIEYVALRSDGDRCEAGRRIAAVEGPAAGILTAERTALNFLQFLSGIATRTDEIVRAAGAHLTILDTRKTVPGLRALSKYAVRCGGGSNHRMGLYDGVLIKDNHIASAGGVPEAIRRVRAAGSSLPIEVEADTLDDVDAAVAAGADIVLLDNMTDDEVGAAVDRVAGRARVEVSGGLTADRVRRLAARGVDFVSVGAITHSAPAVDMSLELEGTEPFSTDPA
jgi:nicotinate-nucleotide pyrophosphorylase (carboxylating)